VTSGKRMGKRLERVNDYKCMEPMRQDPGRFTHARTQASHSRIHTISGAQQPRRSQHHDQQENLPLLSTQPSYPLLLSQPIRLDQRRKEWYTPTRLRPGRLVLWARVAVRASAAPPIRRPQGVVMHAVGKRGGGGAQTVSILLGAMVGLALVSCFRPCSLKSKEHSCLSE